MMKLSRVLALMGLLAVLAQCRLAPAETVARCGKGWLETVNGYPVLHLKGTPYEIGFQHGALLKEQDRKSVV